MIKLDNINKSYKNKKNRQEVLKNLSITLRKGEFTSIIGESGSGKTTLLNIIGLLDKDFEGNFFMGNKDVKLMKKRYYDYLRNEMIGFVFQDYNLIEHLSVYKNIELSLSLKKEKNKRKKIFEILDEVGLLEFSNKRVSKLSGGQKQRVAIARALVKNPKILLLDEPTGALDSKTSEEIMNLIKRLSKDKLVVMVTHNNQIANRYSDRIIKIKDGTVIEYKYLNKSNKEVEEVILNPKKSGFSYIYLLKLSLNNLRVKFFRNLLTFIAFTISIIGICLVISISSGFNSQVEKLKENTLANYPIVISNNSLENEDEKDFEKDKIYSLENSSAKVITKDYFEYFKKLDKNSYLGLSYNYDYSFNILSNFNGKVKLYNNIGMYSIPDDNTYIKENYNIVFGRLPKNSHEVVININKNNQLDKEILNLLGINSKKIKIESVIGKKIKIVLNDTLFKRQDNYFYFNEINKSMYNNSRNITLTITGVIKAKGSLEFNSVMNEGMGGIYYRNSLFGEVFSKNNKSEVVLFQNKKNYDVFSGKKLDLKEKNDILISLGKENLPYLIYIYPKNYEEKENIKNYLDNYSKENSKKRYIDMADDVIDVSKNLVFGVSTVLFVFSFISLLITLILIMIITYTSTIERKKEIGIIRSLGGRRKDIKRLFTFDIMFISLISSIIGIIIVKIISMPINNLLYNLTEIKSLVEFSFDKTIFVILLGIITAVIGSLIPAIKASKFDPVTCLK